MLTAEEQSTQNDSLYFEFGVASLTDKKICPEFTDTDIQDGESKRREELSLYMGTPGASIGALGHMLAPNLYRNTAEDTSEDFRDSKNQQQKESPESNPDVSETSSGNDVFPALTLKKESIGSTDVMELQGV
jgi:hypothetical protein